MNARGHPTLRDAGPPPSLLPSFLRSSLSSPRPPLGSGAEGSSLPLFNPRAEGISLPLGRGILPRIVAALLPLPVSRDPLPNPRGRPRLPLVAATPPGASPDSDEVPPGGAGVAPGCVRGTSERSGGVTSLSLGVWRFTTATEAAFPWFTYPLTRGSPSDARVSPPSGVVPATGGRGSASPGQGAPSFAPFQLGRPPTRAMHFQLA